MTELEFKMKVVRECKERSLMTYSFSKRGLRQFRFWFYRYGKKHCKLSEAECKKEWSQFIRAFNITINEH